MATKSTLKGSNFYISCGAIPRPTLQCCALCTLSVVCNVHVQPILLYTPFSSISGSAPAISLVLGAEEERLVHTDALPKNGVAHAHAVYGRVF